MIEFLKQHFYAILYMAFWLSLAADGLVAPPERVSLLDSTVVTEGWHLSLMALCFGLPMLVLYLIRMRRTPEREN